ncbi:sialidase family protein [Allostreptomyces psammosilenae]|uniref:exo-alpha-sialidase n=1 Tax=Allostreptomyces psammosilenae TaxID=1892865 RepID=A0A853A5N8_9ACTN|nr:sialidase family protein [Allostreptomyces psammosilenae]NYI06001.1 sialidase-1 [Allostreptomyces psammosilenae]
MPSLRALTTAATFALLLAAAVTGGPAAGRADGVTPRPAGADDGGDGDARAARGDRGGDRRDDRPGDRRPDAATACTTSLPFTSGTQGYHTFRIPAVVQAGPADAPVLLAFAEGRRHSASDTGDIDVVLRRSTDGGCTWGPLQLVADVGPDTIGNPTPVVDPATGRVTLLTCTNPGGVTERQIRSGAVAGDDGRRVHVQHSDDQGATWSAPREITADVKPADWHWYATGPGHAVVLEHGEARGRLLVPANHSWVAPDGSVHDGGHTIYSDDGGDTWRLGYVEHDPADGISVNETTLAELPDGRVYLNARDQDGASPESRADTHSLDGGLTVAEPFTPQPQLAGPVVQGSVLQLRADPADGSGAAAPLLFSGPSAPDARRRMALRTSADGGETWREWLVVTHSPAGYSDLVQLDPATVGLLYETGRDSSHETIAFARIPLDQAQLDQAQTMRSAGS